MIFVNVRDTKISVTGDTFNIRSKLGAAGLGFKFNKDKRQWTGRSSLKALEFLADQSGAILTPEANDEIALFHKAAQKRAAYMASRRAN
jgi:hypothetical protein